MFSVQSKIVRIRMRLQRLRTDPERNKKQIFFWQKQFEDAIKRLSENSGA